MLRCEALAPIGDIVRNSTTTTTTAGSGRSVCVPKRLQLGARSSTRELVRRRKPLLELIGTLFVWILQPAECLGYRPFFNT